MYRCYILFFIFCFAGGAVGFNNAASITNFPYFASVESRGKFACAACIIDDFYVVSSNSCMVPHKYSASLGVRIGTSKQGVRGGWYKVINMITYNSNMWTQSDGFALLQVETPMPYSAKVSYVFPARDGPQENQTGSIITWKSTQRGSPLLTAAVKVLSPAACSAAYQGVLDIADNMFCVLPDDNESYSKLCLANLGAPFYSRHQLCGVVAFNPGCQGQSRPLVLRAVAGAVNFFIAVFIDFGALIS